MIGKYLRVQYRPTALLTLIGDTVGGALRAN